MASSADTVIAKFRAKYPDCSTSDAQVILSDVIKEVYTRMQVRNKEITLNVTDGTREYALDVDITSIQTVIYKPSSDETGWIILEATNTDKLDALDPYWRTSLDEDDPTKYYITSTTDTDSAKNVIGFIDIPDTTTSAGYPIVAIQSTHYAALTGSETMPSNLLNDHVLMYGMRYYYSLDRDEKMAEFWENKYEKEIAKNTNHLRGLSGDDDPTIMYSPVFTLTQSI